MMADAGDQNLVQELLFEQDTRLSLKGAGELFETVFMPSRNLTARTRIEYRHDVRQLLEFLGAHGVVAVEQVSLGQLQTFLAELDAQGLSGVTRRRKTTSIRRFFGFLSSSGLIPHDPTLQLIPPEREFKEPRYLSAQEYMALLQACSSSPRDSAIIELLLQTGIRLSEAVSLTTYDVELPARITQNPIDVGTLHIHGTGRNGRTIPLNYKACQAVSNWLAIRPSTGGVALFFSQFGHPMGPRGIELMVKKYMDQAGIRDASVHTLRHTMAVHHIAKGTDLEALRNILGHADIRTTSIYISTAKFALERDVQDHAL